MFCEKCGNRLQDGAHFCEKCGAKVADCKNVGGNAPEEPVSPVKSVKKRTKKAEKEPKKMNFFIRIILLIVVGLLIWNAAGNLAVNFAGKSAFMRVTSFSSRGKNSGNGKHDFLWTVNYEFNADDGELYSGHAGWHGTATNAALGLDEYHVGYLPSMPKINRMVKHESIKDLVKQVKEADRQGKLATGKKIEIAIVAASTIFICVAELLLAYLLICMALPELPIPLLIRRKKKNTGKKKKK